MVLDARPSMKYLLVHVNMGNKIDVMLNKKSSLSLKVVVTVVIIVVMTIFIGVLNI